MKSVNRKVMWEIFSFRSLNIFRDFIMFCELLTKLTIAEDVMKPARDSNCY